MADGRVAMADGRVLLPLRRIRQRGDHIPRFQSGFRYHTRRQRSRRCSSGTSRPRARAGSNRRCHRCSSGATSCRPPARAGSIRRPSEQQVPVSGQEHRLSGEHLLRRTRGASRGSIRQSCRSRISKRGISSRRHNLSFSIVVVTTGRATTGRATTGRATTGRATG